MTQEEKQKAIEELKSGKTNVVILGTRKSRGLGDVVASIAQPIARTIDRVAGTDIEHCESCAERKARLNRIRISGS